MAGGDDPDALVGEQFEEAEEALARDGERHPDAEALERLRNERCDRLGRRRDLRLGPGGRLELRGKFTR